MTEYMKFEKFLETEINNKKNQYEYWYKERNNFPTKQLIDKTLEIKKIEIRELEALFSDLNESNFSEIQIRYENMIKSKNTEK